MKSGQRSVPTTAILFTYTWGRFLQRLYVHSHAVDIPIVHGTHATRSHAIFILYKYIYIWGYASPCCWWFNGWEFKNGRNLRNSWYIRSMWMKILARSRIINNNLTICRCRHKWSRNTYICVNYYQWWTNRKEIWVMYLQGSLKKRMMVLGPAYEDSLIAFHRLPLPKKKFVTAFS